MIAEYSVFRDLNDVVVVVSEFEALLNDTF